MTVIFLTENRLPSSWASYHKNVLLDAVGSRDLITISRKPLGFGQNIIQTEPRSIINIYRQILRGARLAKTEYIAIAEDDTLYPKEHFIHTKKDTFLYNYANWKVFNWGTPIYHWTPRQLNYAMTAPRKLTIEALEERFDKDPAGDMIWGELGRYELEGRFGVTRRPSTTFYTEIPVININHDRGFDDYAKRHVKKMGKLKAYDIPHWGRADKIIERFSL